MTTKLKSNPALDAAVTVAAFALVVGGGVATYTAVNGTLSGSRHAHGEVAQSLAAELTAVAHDEDASALRAWLLKVGPDAAHQAVLSLDNQNDRAGTVRLSCLRAIHALGSEGLSDESLKAWAVALRSLANVVLHEGPDRADYLARSYVMEGRVADAALEYRRYPASPASAEFFKTYPDLSRTPASKR
jgi:hemoglobin-like flavoprotein